MNIKQIMESVKKVGDPWLNPRTRLFSDGSYTGDGHDLIACRDIVHDLHELWFKKGESNNEQLKAHKRSKYCRSYLIPAPCVIKPDLHLALRRKSFYQLLCGTKTIEYRQVKPYWTSRIGKWVGNPSKYIMFRDGYSKDGLRILAEVNDIRIVQHPILGWRGKYYALSFKIISRFIYLNGKYYKRGLLDESEVNQ